MKKETLFVSFSGGRTSAYMCWWLLKNKCKEYNLIFVFANTGQEHEKTLEFVDKVDKWLGLNLVWVEAVVDPRRGKGVRHKVVSYETASRYGEPFEAYIAKEGIPNAAYPQCSERLKTFPMESYRRSLGFRAKHMTAIGIRSDEIDRMNINAIRRKEVVYPLIKWHPITKAEIRHWWAEQDFDLDIPEHLGNCVTCWKKSDRKLMTIAKQEPWRFDFFRRMESKYRQAGAGDEDRVFFRQHRTVSDIFEKAESSFFEFEDRMPELQYRLFDPIDMSSGCAESCEIISEEEK